RLLSAIGIWADVAAQVQPILTIRISDGRAGEGPSPLALEFDHAEIEEGPMGHMLEDRHLRPALLGRLGDLAAVRRTGGAVTDHRPDPAGVTVTLSDGTTLRAAVLIGCDGRASPSAARAGIRRWGRDYAQSSLVCAVDHALPHRGVAHQFFMPGG